VVAEMKNNQSAIFSRNTRYSSFRLVYRGKNIHPALYLLLDQAGEIQHGVVPMET
jgi:hypothetical protein